MKWGVHVGQRNLHITRLFVLFSKRGVSERAYTVLKSKQFHLKRLQFISLENGVSTAETLADLPCIS
ncbi:hypothetical protein CV717_01815 [Bacillus cereus]|nr:hypothetical protein CPZ32_14690 [Bacillus cereus]OUA62089.1 hypothetical protein BK786_27390 [Bacillus thuringiensis serovar thailandensis]PFU36655.1 hypothetical protein COK69_00930 [Bacillus cereus]PWN73407.1 hypothetical protein CV741_17595 [Bacillus cereus]PWN79178.1 hypothetical protein CV717_01815 [Bacillus cereus]